MTSQTDAGVAPTLYTACLPGSLACTADTKALPTPRTATKSRIAVPSPLASTRGADPVATATALGMILERSRSPRPVALPAALKIRSVVAPTEPEAACHPTSCSHAAFDAAYGLMFCTASSSVIG